MAVVILEDVKQKLELLAKKICGAQGIDLMELKIGGRSNDFQIQITADKPSGGITIGECARLNKAIVAAIVQESVLTPGTFSLEVSSPGIETPHQ